MKKVLEQNEDFMIFLKSSLTAVDYEGLHKRLGISKKMLTSIINNPKKIKADQLYSLMLITGKELSDFIPFIKSNYEQAYTND